MNEIRRKNAPVFSLRAAAVIQRGDRFLFCKNDSHDCFYLVGGGIEPGESSEEAVLRECFEETGFHFEISRPVYVLERFYTAENISRHEITFIYLMKENAFPIPDGRNTDRSDEHLYWFPLEKISELQIAPPFIRDKLKSLPLQLTHTVSHE